MQFYKLAGDRVSVSPNFPEVIMERDPASGGPWVSVYGPKGKLIAELSYYAMVVKKGDKEHYLRFDEIAIERRPTRKEDE